MARTKSSLPKSEVAQGTNILDVKIPPQLRKRIDLGIDWFTEALGGQGMVPSNVMMLTGTPGAGKSTLFRQLADSITASGKIAIYNSGEESPYQVAMAAERMKLKNGFKMSQEQQASELIRFARKVQKANPKKTVFILQDSIQTLDDGKYSNGVTNSSTALRCTEMLAEWAKETYGIVLFIGQVNKDGQFSGKNGIKHWIDAHAHIYIDGKKSSDTYGERLFEVSKNRWGVTGKTFIVGIQDTGLYLKGYVEYVKS